LEEFIYTEKKRVKKDILFINIVDNLIHLIKDSNYHMQYFIGLDM